MQQLLKILAKGYLPISLTTPLKVNEILNVIRMTVWKINPDYDSAIKRLHLYYDMKLVTIGMDNDKHLIVHFPVFIEPHTQLPLKLYQIETVPVQIRGKNTQVQSYNICR